MVCLTVAFALRRKRKTKEDLRIEKKAQKSGRRGRRKGDVDAQADQLKS
jgi:hypothetical protein